MSAWSRRVVPPFDDAPVDGPPAQAATSSDDLPDLRHLPPPFLFGVSSAAYSIEGSARVGGRTASIWDALAGAPGRTADGSTGATAADHHRRSDEDVALLQRLGVDSYRFSVSWSRVQPGGSGGGSAAGLDFYDRLVDRLSAAGIIPWVTLYHWDLPVELMLAGGWLVRETADAAGDLAELVAGRLGDRVHRWTTMADPLLHMAYGHALGVDAPGLTLLDRAFPVTHHLLLGHARMRDVLAQNRSASIGIANNHTVAVPASGSAADRRAAARYDAYHNRQFADPILTGRYPRLLQPLLDRHPGLVRPGDLDAISQPLDFYGVSYHHPSRVADAPDNATIPFALVDDPANPAPGDQWPVDAGGLTKVLVELRHRYPRLPPMVVTESGAPFPDPPASADRPALNDVDRVSHLGAHLAAVDEAVAAGVDVRGFFHRGLTDGWEGAEGFTRQFGLVALEPGTLHRLPRASFEFYRRVIARHAARRPA